MRREQARRTERAVLAAAHTLLLDEGWTGMTMTAVAARAGVSSQLLYKTYGTKAALAKRLYDVTLMGDDEPEPLRDRPELAAVVAEQDPAQKLALYARLAVTLSVRVGPLYARLRGAATAGDPGLAELVATTERERATGNAGLARDLARRGALRPGLTRQRAVDIVFTLLSIEVIDRLITERGWSPAEVETLLAQQLCCALLAPDDDGR
ncbi:TetR/AcrR family transcriptional regulator [Actinomycetospora straminea]|uniref:TetR/AcrR family transcriptional regulator n=1 Tax=Actinomycetospora straminea TaxID=663607 RepID=UPI00236585ED|nr:TetR/AcrR family transcriptional regulator [Actinomycetospora straminea]MDD7934991.1 helix-turn-helix domain containing protein [Actinomycetospora straminea]